MSLEDDLRALFQRRPDYARTILPGSPGSEPSIKTAHVVEGVDFVQTYSGGPFRSVIIDNITASWCQYSRTGRPIPPFTYGAIQNFAPTNTPEIYWITPLNVPIPTPSNGTLTATFTSDLLPPANGQPVVTPSQQIPLVVTKVITLSGTGSNAQIGSSKIIVGSGAGSAVTVWCALPPGVNSLIVAGGETVTGGTTRYRVNVIGQQSASQYLTATSAPTACIVSPAADNILIVSISNDTGTVHLNNFFLIASFGTQAVAVENNGSPLIIAGNQVDEAGSASFIQTAIAPLGIPFLAISGANAPVSKTIARGATSGHFVRISQLSASFSGATAGAPSLIISDSVGNLWEITTQSVNGATPPISFPIPLTTGNDGSTGDITITLAASGAAGIAGILSGVYSVY